MAEIIAFIPRAELDATQNLLGFVDICRNQLTTFGLDLPYDNPVWDITHVKVRKGKHFDHTLRFSKLISVGRHLELIPMDEPFCSFAKAYIRYQQAMRPVVAIETRLQALRALEAALTENGQEANPTRIDVATLNRTIQICRSHYSEGTAVAVANSIKQIADFMSDNRLLQVPVMWVHGLKRRDFRNRVGLEADERRATSLPSQAALDGLAKIFHLAREPQDVIVSSVTAILCSAPDRISEVLALPYDCEVHQNAQNRNAKAYGLRWRPAKGADPMVKWIIPSMTGVVEQAIERIRNLTEEGRLVAKWYEANPEEIYLPEQYAYLRQQKFISMPELGKILFDSKCDSTSPLAWVRAKKIETIRDLKAKSRPNYVRFSDVEKAVLAMLPSGFPFINVNSNLRYSDALCVVLKNTLTGIRATLQCMIEPISYSHIQARLGNIGTTTSIFDTFGIVEDDGSAVKVNTHQFRHYLNTLAQRGGLSQLDIAKWSGRRNVAQNSAYDHVSGQDLVTQMRSMLGTASWTVGGTSTLAKVALIPRDEFARLKIPTAHTTELGYCIHDFTMSPCQLHRDCIQCEELVCVKGDLSKADRIKQLRAETVELLRLATEADTANEAGANRWVQHQTATLERLDQLCSIFDDPMVPNGAFIQQAQPRPISRIQMAADARAAQFGNLSLNFSLPALNRKTS